MQRLVLKVLCSTLLLLAVVPSVYSQAGNDTGMCVTDDNKSDPAVNCSWTRLSELCTVVETGGDGGSDGDTGDGSNTSPEFSQAKFDMSSFIGGIILVLCVQAGGFFAMRFLKSKEQSSYDPMCPAVKAIEHSLHDILFAKLLTAWAGESLCACVNY
ncbi:hypothetical protein GBF38_011115 [Nibea albiflora]|uniref:Uncharacterized protein n=1 Tax=Nibea albiflora TaxID=240163 RepID=A0ACB7ESH7_NIBAL|nr:hypothetical protein GBF38_011115 [Nibea albiflora]